jgi:hypothetical protein
LVATIFELDIEVWRLSGASIMARLTWSIAEHNWSAKLFKSAMPIRFFLAKSTSVLMKWVCVLNPVYVSFSLFRSALKAP